MTSQIRLTTAKFVDILQVELGRWTEHQPLLCAKELDRLRKATDLVAEDPTTITRNAQKKRVHMILKELWSHLPQVFILCALKITHTHLGTLKSTSFLTEVRNWWQGIDKTDSLNKAISIYSDVLPSSTPKFPATRNIQFDIPLETFVKFIQERFNEDAHLKVTCPFDGNPLPSGRLSSGNSWVDMSFSLDTAQSLAECVTR